MRRIDSTHSIWLFDTERSRFRRLPKGADPAAPALEREWQEYFALDVDAESGSFTVALNPDRTRLLRAWSDRTHPSMTPDPSESPTTELRLEPAVEG